MMGITFIENNHGNAQLTFIVGYVHSPLLCYVLMHATGIATINKTGYFVHNLLH